MITVERRLPQEEVARRGDEIYDTCIAPTVEICGERRYAVIDVVSGAYEIDASRLTAANRLQARCPDAQAWFRQVGSRYATHYRSRTRLVTK